LQAEDGIRDATVTGVQTCALPISQRLAFDYRVTNTSFAGPTMFQRGDTTYFNQRGEPVAKQRSTAIRYLVENAERLAAFAGQERSEERRVGKEGGSRRAWDR